ncbi:hypothetical protein DL766_000346 [Monosporascus sp. MC13-8B]|nr:hypothetical protein DL763_001124 [Monosporascus cannonballus]RYP39524.1 hypothetical protein DL766_000346 [Monosporascus sp. MC13-8B]
MDSSREKLPVTYDDLPEVVIPHSEAQAYVDEGRRVEPGESPPKFLAIDPAQKEVVYPNSPEVVSGHDFTAAGAEGDHVSPTSAEQSLSSDGQRKQTQGRICGCSTKTFWVILVLVLIAMGAAIGGGVGGGMAASRDADNQPLGADASSSTTTPTVATTSSSSPPPTPTVFLNNNTQDFAFQAFDESGYGGRATGLFKAQGHFDLDFNASSYVWQPNGTHCCVTMCRQFTWVGWWCQPRYQRNSSMPFDNIDIGCSGDENLDASKAICASL